MSTEELIRKHILGLLSEAEEQDFQRRLHEDDSLKEELDFQRDLTKVVIEEERLRLKDKLSKIKIDASEPTKNSRKTKNLGLVNHHLIDDFW